MNKSQWKILYILSDNKARYGFVIRRQAKIWRCMIYIHLSRMEGNRHIRSFDPGTGRRMYQITGEGKRLYNEYNSAESMKTGSFEVETEK